MKVIDTIVQNVNIIYYERRLKVVGIQCLRKDAVFLRKCTNSFTRSATLKNWARHVTAVTARYSMHTLVCQSI
jgi:hypothetical protein